MTRGSAILCWLFAVAVAQRAIAPIAGMAQSQMKPLNEAEKRELRIYEAKELTRRAAELRQTGKNLEAIPPAEQALERREKDLPIGHPDLSASLAMLGALYHSVRRYVEAEQLLKRALESREKANPVNLHSVVSTLMMLGDLHDWQCRFTEAEAVFRRALELRERLEKPGSPLLVENLNTLASNYEKQGKYGEAERLYKRALDLRESLTTVPLGAGGQITIGRGYLEHAETMRSLARVYSLQGRLVEAEDLFKQVLKMHEALPRKGLEITYGLDDLADLYAAQRRYSDAEALYLRALKLREQRAYPDHPGIATSSFNLGELHRMQGRYAVAEPLLTRALEVRRKALPAGHVAIATSLAGLARLHTAQGKLSEAGPLLESSLQMLETILPAGHPWIAYTLGDLAFVHQARRDWATAHTYFKRATDLLIRRATRGGYEATSAADNEGGDASRGSRYFDGLITSAFQLAQAEPNRREELSQASFEALPWARQSAAAASLAQMAARNATREIKLGALARERQDLVVEAQVRDKELVAMSSLPAERRSSDAEQSTRRRLADIDARVAGIDRTLAANFPEYADLTRPRPLTTPDAQTLLGSNEALVVPHHTAGSAADPGATFVWVISKSEIRWVRSTLGAGELRKQVTALRCGLDRAAWEATSDGRCATIFKDVFSANNGGPLPFDVARSHDVYLALFGQIESAIRGKSLLFVPSDLLGTLPLHTLVAEKPATALPTVFGDVTWLTQRHPITVLPTVASLRSLRRFAKESKAINPFIGFGNPLLLGPNGNDRSAWRNQECPTAATQRQFASRRISAAKSSFFRDGLADVSEVRGQYPLPETAEELCAVARASGAPDSAVYLGARATEATVKALSASGALAEARIVHFATHGLLAGETQMLSSTKAEPALILTPPEKASEQDDGLLTASEIAQLKLNADWVVLSACNTASAAEDGDNAEALSGLARAFFYAGARALLVSHWAVNSEATVKLITKVFDALREDSSIGRAEALRRSMLAMIGAEGAASHPSNWAPFVVVGEGKY